MVRWWRWCCLRRRSCPRRRCRCGPITFFCILGTVSLVLSLLSFGFAFRHQLFEMLTKCQDKETLIYIADYCQAYRDGQITGSLCHPLCESKQVQYSKCADFHGGKQVGIMSCTDFCAPGQSVPAVLKFPDDNVSFILSDHPESFPDDMDTTDFYQHTSIMIKDLLKEEFGFVPFPSQTNLTELMWEKNSARFTGNKAAQRVAFRSIMMLMNQVDYRVVKSFESSGIVPQIYGTYGAMYLQESCPPGVLDETTVSLTDPKHIPTPWTEKAISIIRLLQLFLRLEQDFPEVLHLCDVKGSNFGVCADGSVKLIDADCVFFDSRMMEMFYRSECQTHEDCNFFDCGGWCQTDAGTCYSVITNNNLETLCRDVLSSRLPKVFGGKSIFSGAPVAIAPKLQAALDECLTYSSKEQGAIPVHKPPLSVLTRLIHLLQQSLSENR